ncbi:MAG: PrsW family intramembrane metalloprotease [Kiritimatiellae bacterium]|nr:PrsW family intramembrane metalloprotease [Kiritimatiellia bacterium]
MQFQCSQCRAVLASDAVTDGMGVSCPECGAQTEVRPYVKKPKIRAISPAESAPGSPGEDLTGTIHTKMASAIGIEKLKGFRLSDLFAEVFSKHSREEVEDYFTVGTAKSTPSILDVDASWPKPWIFMRMALASLAIYFLFWLGWKQSFNTKLLPGLMMIGSFAMPISTLVLFMELNVRRNVSLYMVSRLLFLGGVLALLITLVIGTLADYGLLPNAGYLNGYGHSSAGPMEETAKVLAMVAVARAAKYKYKLNGLLIGAAVGAGFAAFESMGYALDCYTGGTLQGTIGTLVNAATEEEASLADLNGVIAGSAAMLDNIVVRGILSPLGHIVWSAIAGCALWRVIKGQEFKWRMLCDENFIRLLLVPVALHMIWNSTLNLPFYGKYILVGVAGWFVCLSLVQEGLHEVAAEQAEARNAIGNGAADAAEGGAE